MFSGFAWCLVVWIVKYVPLEDSRILLFEVKMSVTHPMGRINLFVSKQNTFILIKPCLCVRRNAMWRRLAVAQAEGGPFSAEEQVCGCVFPRKPLQKGWFECEGILYDVYTWFVFQYTFGI